MSVSTTEQIIIGPHGEIPVRIYAPAAGERSISPRLGLVWAHGGGFAGGDLDMPENDWVARQLAHQGLAVVTVDYRLSPLPDGEHTGTPQARRFPYPVASEEVTAAFAWATTSGAHVPAANWALGGASAGGNLATGAALRLRDTGGPAPYALMLAYPVLHAALPPVPTELAAKVGTLSPPFNFGAEQIARMNLAYVQDPGALLEAYAFPGGHDVSGLPPTFILNCDSDSLRASGQQFGAELAAAGVDVTVIREPGTSHGHLNDPDDPAALRSITRIADWLTRSHLAANAGAQ